MMKRRAGNRVGLRLVSGIFIFLMMGSWLTMSGQSMTARDYFLLGAAKYKCNACAQAVDDFAEAIRQNKKYAEAYYGRSLAYNCMAEYDKGLRDIDRAIRLNPKQVLYREGKARIRSAKGDLKGGTREYVEALKMDSLCWQAWYGLAMNSLSSQEFTTARNAFDMTIELQEKYAMAWVGRAKMELNLANNQAGLLDLIRAAERAPEYAPIYEMRSLTQFRLSNFAAAVSDANEALRLDPELENSYYYRGDAHLSMQSYNKADADFAMALKLDKQFAEAWFKRGICHDEIGDLKGAKKYYSKAISKDRVHKEAYVARAEVWLKMDKIKQAVGDLDNAINLDKQDVDLLVQRGYLYIGLEENQSAMSDFTQAIRQQSGLAEAYYGMGLALYDEGNIRGACDNWEQALSLGDARAQDMMNKYCVE